MNNLSYNIQDFLDVYPDLKLRENTEQVIIDGMSTLDHTYDNVYFYKQYKICITLNIDNIPNVCEIENAIDKDYSHIYMNGDLCLGINSEIISLCVENNLFDLIKWYTNFVIPYFYSYEYYQRFGVYPFGERSHGCMGILEYYMEFFNINDMIIAYKCLKFAINNEYKGHNLCPCGSGRIIRKCHKNELYKANTVLMNELIQSDLHTIDKEVKENKQNSNKTK